MCSCFGERKLCAKKPQPTEDRKTYTGRVPTRESNHTQNPKPQFISLMAQTLISGLINFYYQLSSIRVNESLICRDSLLKQHLICQHKQEVTVTNVCTSILLKQNCFCKFIYKPWTDTKFKQHSRNPRMEVIGITQQHSRLSQMEDDCNLQNLTGLINEI